MRSALLGFIALSLVSLAASAGEADICYSPAVEPAASTPPTNDTVFECPTAGSKTLPELAADGWDIVQLSPVVAAPGTSLITQQLVIQRKS